MKTKNKFLFEFFDKLCQQKDLSRKVQFEKMVHVVVSGGGQMGGW